VMSDLDATAAWAGKESKGEPYRMAITGFCWGGRVVWLYAAHASRLKAGVAWYGRLTDGHNPASRQQAIDVAGSLKAPVLRLYGGADTGIPLDGVWKMQEKLKAAGDTSKIHVFENAPHAFYADYRPSYRKEVAAEAWGMFLAWLKQHGV
jgi:carboxymethylenebutenolidase